CQAPNRSRFIASMNNVSFVLPSNFSILQADHQSVPGVFTTDFPAMPPVAFAMVVLVENGVGELEKLQKPPADLPVC
ncbi:hypothetical protein Tco_0614321, partial [Tanacetum coccineum]